MLNDKTILITGGTGSFGNTVLKHFLTSDIGEIRIFSRDEKKQDDMRHDSQARFPEYANKVTFYIVVLLILIDRFLSSGWAETVIPIVLFADLLVMFVLFFALYDRKDRHLISVVLLGLFNLVSIPYSIHSWPIENWIAFSFQIASMALFIVMLLANRKELVYEIKARFATNTK